MSRHDFRRPIAEHISNIRSELAKVPAEKRLHVIAEALYDMNPTGADEVLRASCGCYEWDNLGFIALANPANVLVLVEALEKAQGMEAYWKTQCRGITDHCEELQARIAELESRTVTVKLPDIMPPEAAPAHYWGSSESMAYADGYNKSAADLKTSFAQACSSAGVNVEFE